MLKKGLPPFLRLALALRLILRRGSDTASVSCSRGGIRAVIKNGGQIWIGRKQSNFINLASSVIKE